MHVADVGLRAEGLVLDCVSVLSSHLSGHGLRFLRRFTDAIECYKVSYLSRSADLTES